MPATGGRQLPSATSSCSSACISQGPVSATEVRRFWCLYARPSQSGLMIHDQSVGRSAVGTAWQCRGFSGMACSAGFPIDQGSHELGMPPCGQLTLNLFVLSGCGRHGAAHTQFAAELVICSGRRLRMDNYENKRRQTTQMH